MNANLTKYLSDVFRNEVQGGDALESKNKEVQAATHIVDKKINQFVIDNRFALRLDEII
jgi:hypothetical protein